jgi:hypothetical protein
MARGGAGQFMVTRMFAGDEELGKKDDDHKPGTMNPWSPSAVWSGPSVRYRSRKRWLVGGFALLCIWAFFYYMPPDILEPMNRPPDPYGNGQFIPPKGPQRPQYQGPPARNSPVKQAPKGPPPGGPKKIKGDESVDHYYDGDIFFYKLPSSLHAISRTQGFRRMNRNVLFAASSLKSASVLIPLACEMTRTGANNYVHVAILGRSELTLDEILEVNGVDRKECKAYWHDGRPDYAKYSSDFRAEASTASALDHINSYMHPQVVITDDSLSEDAFFVRQLRLKAAAFEWPILELPAGEADRLKWITRLEAQSLAAWHKTQIDIVIQSPTDASGSLMRLLKSLANADYSGLTPPRITVELPPDVDALTRSFLEFFMWPPANALQPRHTSQLIIHHRIPGQQISPEEASVRFLESFYPSHPNFAHVLLLAPNTQLSPIYFQWLKYQLLQHRYSTVSNAFSEELLGISLELPAMHLNGTTSFTPPSPEATDKYFAEHSKPVSKGTKPPFMWQAPNSNAALYFGDKWIELHSFVQHRLTQFHSNPKSIPRAKLVSENLPAWTEYFLELIRARGYGMLYPASSQDAEALVTVHKELYHPPEEFSKKNTPKSNDEEAGAPAIPPNNEPFVVTKDPFTHPPTVEHALSSSYQPLHVQLPFAGEDPDIGSIPHLAFDGQPINPMDENSLAETYAQLFRKEIGGCTGDRQRKVVQGNARDLFCFGDEKESDYMESVEPPTVKTSEDDLLDIAKLKASVRPKAGA